MRLTLILAALFILNGCDRHKDAAPQPQAEQLDGIKGVHRDFAGKQVPDMDIRDADDAAANLADQTGKPLLVNLWASWCGPCVKELPTLQALGRRSGAPRIIAVSEDMAPHGSVDAFLKQHKLTELEAWHDPKMALSEAMGAQVLPTTILYGADGKEKWRYVGDLDWTGPEAAKLLAEAR